MDLTHSLDNPMNQGYPSTGTTGTSSRSCQLASDSDLG
jgi:hypothetical protein